MEFQSTLPRRERPGDNLTKIAKKYDFNPRSRGGSDVHSNESCVVIDDFNPRSRGGSDSGYHQKKTMMPEISIHAPAEGATSMHY